MEISSAGTSDSSDTDSNSDGNRRQVEKRLIRKYHQEGFKYQEIADLLCERHNIYMSLRKLKRILNALGLKRRAIPEAALEDILTIVLEEIKGGGSCLGYKALWRRLRHKYGLQVKRHTVLEVLRVADPEGIYSRSKRRLRRRVYSTAGPNCIWHMDGYDKLKPFKFPIHGCIDGYSRRILWLHVASSNNNPAVIAHYYLNTVKKLGLIPRVIRSDCGTENTVVEKLQQALRFDDEDKSAGLKSFIKGKSTSNQRIESYWGQMRKSGVDFWISFFKDLRDTFLFNDSDPIHVECIRYCFGPLIERELSLVRKEWNNHPIRRQKNVESPAGRPNHMYYCPSKYNTCDFKITVDPNVIQTYMTEYTSQPVLIDHNFRQLIHLLIPTVKEPTSVSEALNLYNCILERINECNN